MVFFLYLEPCKCVVRKCYTKLMTIFFQNPLLWYIMPPCYFGIHKEIVKKIIIYVQVTGKNMLYAVEKDVYVLL